MTGHIFMRRLPQLTALLWCMVASAAAGEQAPGMPGGLALDVKPAPAPVISQAQPARTALPAYEPAPKTMSAAMSDADVIAAIPCDVPLVPLSNSTDPATLKQLKETLLRYVSHSPGERDCKLVIDMLEFEQEHPYAAALMLNVGLEYARQGFFSRAERCLKRSWELAQHTAEPRQKLLADRALAELLGLYAWAGAYELADVLIPTAVGRGMTGVSERRLFEVQSWREFMKTQPARGTLCGPFAVGEILKTQNGTRSPKQVEHAIGAVLAQVSHGYTQQEAAADKLGTNLLEVCDVAKSLGLDLQVAKRVDPRAELPTPSIIHWGLNHFSAVVGRRGDRYTLHDPGVARFGAQHVVVSQAALVDSGSGYALIPAGRMPAGWVAVPSNEARGIWGRGITDGPPIDPPSPCNPAQPSGGGGGGGGSPCGMPVWAVHLSHMSLALVDAPLFYQPAYGPPVVLEMRYSEADSLQLADGTYGNFGPKWTMTWFSTVTVTNVAADTMTAVVYVPGGGGVTHVLSRVSGNVFKSGYNRDSSTVLDINQDTGVAAISLPDGSRRNYQARGFLAGVPATNFYMTSHIQADGLGLQFAFDSQYRLVGVTDATGLVTTLTYAVAGDPAKVSKVTDPFGRTALMSYANGRLAGITDMVGLTSTFTYSTATGDIISALTTPYGTTSYSRSGTGYERLFTATDPGGDQYDYQMTNSSAIPDSTPYVPVGTALVVNPSQLNNINVHYWDRKGVKLGRGDPTKSRTYHYFHGADNRFSRLLSSIKEPLEERVWLFYPGQVYTWYDTGITIGKPCQVARVLQDGTTQIWKYEYLPNGNLTLSEDPQGRQTHLVYAANGIDVLEVRQAVVGTLPQDRVRSASFAYNANHQVTQQVDASGQLTQFAYTAQRQLDSVTLPQRSGQPVEKVQYTYHATTKRLVSVTNPGAVSTSLTYDGFGRVQTMTGPDGYVMTYAYDNLDRVIQVTYPDGTNEQIAYDKLDAGWQRDRLGRWSRMWYDHNRKLVAQRDAQGQVTAYDWCRCGALKRITDPMGRITLWDFDLQGRMTRKTYPDGRIVQYGYEPLSGRMATVTDAKGQVTNMSYGSDNRLQRIWYTNAVVPTAEVNFSYDGLLGRIASMSDGTGSTTYTYAPLMVTTPSPAVTDRGRLVSIDGPLANDTATFTYDAWGRSSGMSINSAPTTLSYDAVGRLGTLVNPIGSFGFGYVGVTDRLSQVTSPNGMQSVFGYAGTMQDLRLQSILHRRSGGQRIVENTYGYNVNGDITSWTRQNGTATAESWMPSYDGIGQLTGVDVRSGGTTGTIQQGLSYVYDGAGNRLSSTVAQGTALSVVSATFNTVNQATSIQGGGGKMRVRGHLNEPGTVKVQGTTVPVRSDLSFTTVLDAPSGTSTFAVQATDLRGNTLTKNYQVSAGTAGTARAVAYDFNGNTTDDGLRTYTWDANDRLVSIMQGTASTIFTYDGMGRRVRLLELDNAVVVADRRFVWVGAAIVEERNAALVVQRRFFGNGMQILTGTKAGYYTFARDHLGSIQAITDATGAVRTVYAYSPWGERTKVSGDIDVDEGFTGHWHHRSGLVLSWFRAYDPQLGRWLSRDPLGEKGGLNLYAYVRNSPTGRYDPLGLAECGGEGGLPGGLPAPMPGGGGPAVPEAPPGVSVDNNMSEAQAAAIGVNPQWFKNKVQNKGPWDYKQLGPQYEAFGNFNYGATGSAFGFPLQILLQEAGLAQVAAGTSKPEWGTPGTRGFPGSGTGSFGDDPADQQRIIEGYRYYQRWLFLMDLKRTNDELGCGGGK